MKSFLYILFAFSFCLFSCKKDKVVFDETKGHLRIVFSHKIDSDSLQRYSMLYQNAAGNNYEIDELKYFISEVKLYFNHGNYVLITDNNTIHYVDLDFPNSMTWNVSDPIAPANFDSVSFIFGLDDAHNISNSFLNPPEVNMFWPEALGGGYHFMQFNGKWRKPDSSIEAFNLHLGRGQLYSGTSTSPDSIIGFVNNCFSVSLPHASFSITKSTTTQINLLMNINNWFAQPHVYDFNFWGGSIMQNQAAMQTIKENGKNIFSVLSIQ
ncbi:MAG: MbnP family protein [Bacteroidota bacterium]